MAIVLDRHRQYEVMRGIKWYFIELPKFRRTHPSLDEKLNQWLAFLDDYDKELVRMAEKKNPTLKKARAEVTYLTGDEAVKRMEFLHEKWEMDRISDINHAKEEGIKLGEKLGEKAGRIKTAKRFLEQGVDVEIVIKATGLTKEEVEELVKGLEPADQDEKNCQ